MTGLNPLFRAASVSGPGILLLFQVCIFQSFVASYRIVGRIAERIKPLLLNVVRSVHAKRCFLAVANWGRVTRGILVIKLLDFSERSRSLILDNVATLW